MLVTCSDDSILSRRARSTLRILPRIGSTAWNSRLRPCLAEPPAESPSTMKSSVLAGSRSWHSARPPGSRRLSSAPLRRVSSRALRAASRASAASTILPTMSLASFGCSSNQAPSCSPMMPLDDRLHLRRDELVLRLAGELRVRHLDREHAGEALARVLAGEVDLLLLGDAAFARVLVDDAGQRRAEAGEMRAAVALRDVVGEAAARSRGSCRSTTAPPRR